MLLYIRRNFSVDLDRYPLDGAIPRTGWTYFVSTWMFETGFTKQGIGFDILFWKSTMDQRMPVILNRTWAREAHFTQTYVTMTTDI